MSSRRSAIPLFLGVLLASAGCDHAAKQIAIASLSETGSLSFGGDLLHLQLAFNPGAFLSMGAALPEWVRGVVFIGLVPVLVALMCTHLLRTSDGSPPVVVGLGLVAGGGLANWADRLLHDGAVTDFVALSLGPLRTGIFNFADVAVMFGMAVLVIGWRRENPKHSGGLT